MTNSTWRIGDFYFPQNKEPDRVDVKTVRETKKAATTAFLAYTQLYNYGYNPTSIVMQGVLKDFLAGSTGDYGLEKLKAESQREKEVIVELENFNGTDNLRRYYGVIGDFDYNMSGNRPGLFDYRVSITCPNPFSYRAGANGLEVDETTINTSETNIDLGTNDFTAETDFYFRFHNESGAAITELIIGESSTTSGNYITVTGSLAQGSSWLIYPFKFDDVPRVHGIETVWTINADTTNTDDLMEINASDSGVTTSGASVTSTGRWPQLTGASMDIKAKATGNANGELLVQWRDIM